MFFYNLKKKKSNLDKAGAILSKLFFFSRLNCGKKGCFHNIESFDKVLSAHEVPTDMGRSTKSATAGVTVSLGDASAKKIAFSAIHCQAGNTKCQNYNCLEIP